MRTHRTSKLFHRFASVRKRLFGFTLIESLVVVGIIGFTVGITLTSLNVGGIFKSSHDTVRKQDLNTLHKAFTQYFIENRCVPLSSTWQQVTCDGEVPDELKPYIASIPCDPETHEKYEYELLDNQCKQCNGGCGVCLGFRFLTTLNKQEDPPQGSGCSKDHGCGKNNNKGKPYNWGIAMSPGKCSVPVPTVTPTIASSPTIEPSPTPSPSPSNQIIWISNANNTITRVNSSGTPIGPVISGNGLAGPYSITLVGNEVWVLNINQSISRFNLDGIALGIHYMPNGNRFPHSAVAFDNEYWFSYYSQNGNGIMKLHQDGTQKGNLILDNSIPNPFGLALVGSDIWVTNDSNKTIQRLSKLGIPVGTAITGNGLHSPEGIAVVGNQVWVTNLLNDTISRFNLDGTSAGNVLSGNNLTGPFGIAVVGNEVWVANTLNGANSISRFNVNGTVSNPPLTGQSLPSPWSIAVIPDGDGVSPTPLPTPTNTPIPTATPIPAPTVSQAQVEVWIGSSSPKFLNRYTLGGQKIGPVSTSIDVNSFAPSSLKKVGSFVYVISAENSKFYVTKFNLDGSISVKTEVVTGFGGLFDIESFNTTLWTSALTIPSGSIFRLNSNGSVLSSFAVPTGSSTLGETKLIPVNNEMWIVDYTTASIRRYNEQGTKIGSTMYLNNQSGSPTDITKPNKLKDGTQVGNQVWVGGSMGYPSKSIVARLNLDGTVAAPPIHPPIMYTPYTGEIPTGLIAYDLFVYNNEVWILWSGVRSAITRHEFSGQQIGEHIYIDEAMPAFFELIHW